MLTTSRYVRARTWARRLARPAPRAETATRPAATSLSRIVGRPVRAFTVALSTPAPVTITTLAFFPRLSVPVTTFVLERAGDDLRPSRPGRSPSPTCAAPRLRLAWGRDLRRSGAGSQGPQSGVGVDPPARDAGNRDGARLDRLLDLPGRRSRHERERERGDSADDRSGRGCAEERDVGAAEPGRRVLARGGDPGTGVREPVEPVVLVGGRDAQHVGENGRVVGRRAALVTGRRDDEDTVEPGVLRGGRERQIVDRRAQARVDHAGAVVGRPDDPLRKT